MPQQNTLSERETEILQLVATGLTNREIAQKLTISPNTVKVHLSNIFEKINVSSRTEATLYGIEHGIVDVPGAENSETVLTWQDLVRKNISIILPLFIIVFAVMAAPWRTVLFPPTSPTPVALGDVPERWQELAPMPEIRTGMALAAYDENIYAIAGEGPEGVSSSVFRYLTAEDRWEQLSDKPTPVADVEGALIGEKVYIPGGRLADGNPTDILEIYDPRQDIWEKGAPTPQPICAYTLVDYEGQLYLFGGWNGKNALDTVYIYDPLEDAWEEGTPMPSARYDVGAAVLVDKIVLLGGRTGSSAAKDAWSYYPSRDLNGEDPWGEFLDMPEARYDFGVASVYDTIYVVGGILESKQVGMDGLLMNGEEWIPFETIQDFNQRSIVMVPLGSQLMIFDTPENGEETQTWMYQAFYYSIYIPLMP